MSSGPFFSLPIIGLESSLQTDETLVCQFEPDSLLQLFSIGLNDLLVPSE